MEMKAVLGDGRERGGEVQDPMLRTIQLGG